MIQEGLGNDDSRLIDPKHHVAGHRSRVVLQEAQSLRPVCGRVQVHVAQLRHAGKATVRPQSLPYPDSQNRFDSRFRKHGQAECSVRIFGNRTAVDRAAFP
jgi:hypothetical protein